VSPDQPRLRVFVAGATGTIGRATVRALLRRGHEVTCFVRPHPGGAGTVASGLARAGAVLRSGDAGSLDSILRDGLRGERFDAVVSCMASRSGAPRDAWAVDHLAHGLLLDAAISAGVTQWVQLSAICVQKPRLEFQRAKLAFEESLMASGLAWSIVRPTAFFKSLSGQVQRVREGRPFLVFGDGTLTRCKPISDGDVADYLAACLGDPSRQRRVLPIGGPGPAITPREQGELLFALAGRPARFRQVPVGLLDAVAGLLGAAGRIVPSLADKAEFARIARYYATESMLVWDADAGRYDADATPSVGRDLLADHYGRLLSGEAGDDRGDHAVF
jgi:divinyl chlorophyllide a 8-vinyl-reductase